MNARDGSIDQAELAAVLREEREKRRVDINRMLLARALSLLSPDPSTQVGAVLISRAGDIVGAGFNSFPTACDHSPHLYADRELKYERILHAEVKALIAAGHRAADCTLYVWPPGYSPTCARCAAQIIQAGVRRVVGVAPLPNNDMAQRWRATGEIALQMYCESHVLVELVPYSEFDRALSAR